MSQQPWSGAIDPMTGQPVGRPPGVMDRLLGGILGQQSHGGLLTDEDQRAARQRALMAMGAQLLSASGPSPQRTSLGQALGPAIMAGQQAQDQASQGALSALLLKSKLSQKDKAMNPAAVQEYEYAKQNGFKGSFEEWKRVGSAQPQKPADVQGFEYYQQLPPDQQKQFMALQRQPTVPQVVMIGNVPHLVDRLKNTATPLSTLQTEADSAAELARSKATGQATGEAQGAMAKKGINALNVLETLELADPLVDVATGSGAGSAADKVAAFFGESTTGDQAIAQLKIIQANLMTNMPRMEGPQSDRDVQLYREAAGELGDPGVPRERKKAALKTIRALQQKYVESPHGPRPDDPSKKRSREEILKQYGL